MQSHWPKVTRIQRYKAAGGITGTAINALRLLVQGSPCGAVLGNRLKFGEILIRHEVRQDGPILLKKRYVTHRQIANDRQISQRFDSQVGANRCNQRAASKTFTTVYE